MKLSKDLRKIIYVCLCIIPFLAFYVSGFGIGSEWNMMLFPYITGKNFAFRILVEIAAASSVLLMIIDKNFRPKKSWVLYSYSFFVFILLLADIFSINPIRSFFSNFERMEGFISHAHLFLYFLILITIFKNKADWIKYNTILFISNIPVVFIGLMQLLGLETFSPMKLLPSLRDAIHKVFYPSQGGNQLDSTLGNSTYLAIYSVFFIFLFFITYLEEKRKQKKTWPYLTMIILNIIILFYTQTRGAQIGFAIGIFVSAVIIFFAGKKYKELKNKRKISLILIITTLLLYILLISFGNSSFVKNSSTLNRLAKVSKFGNPLSIGEKIKEVKDGLYNPNVSYNDLYNISGDGTFTSRMLNIKMSLEGFKEKPILGWGQDNYFYVFAKYNDARMYAQEPWFDRTHNVFMDWLIAGGILGLLAYLGLYIVAIYMMWSKKVKKYNGETSDDFLEKALFTGLLVAYFIHNIFVFDNLISYMLYFIVLAYISVRFTHNKNQDKVENLNESDVKKKKIIYGPIIIVLLLSSLYFFNIKYINANTDIIRGLAPKTKEGQGPIDTFNASLNSFKKAIAIGGIATLESREQLTQTTLTLLNQISSSGIDMNSELFKNIYVVIQDNVNTIKIEYEKLINKNADPRSLSIFATFLRSIGDKDAIIYAKKAYDYAPNKQSIASEYIQNLLQDSNFEEANKVAEKMYLSDKSFETAKDLYALTLINIGKFDEGEALLKDTTGYIKINEALLSSYITNKKEDRIIKLLKNNLIINPKDVNTSIGLASIYMLNNNKAEAVKVLNNLKKVSPDLAEAIDNYIETVINPK